MKILPCNNTNLLAKEIAKETGMQLVSNDTSSFSDGELSIKIKEDLYQQDVIITHQLYPDVNQNLLQLLFLINAAKKRGAKHIYVIIPYFAYSRMDHKKHDHDFITASCIASLLEAAGLESLITIDLHSSQVEGFFRTPVKNITMLELFEDTFKSAANKNTVVVSPDIGGKIRSTSMSEFIGAPLAVIYKQRDASNVVTMNGIMGDVKGKDCILVDDILGSGQTIINAIQVLEEAGAKSIEVAISHNLMDISSGVLEKILSKVKRFSVSNSIPIDYNKLGLLSKKLNMVDIRNPIIKCIKSCF